jgi:predicted nucleotidyltransferase
VKEQVQAAAAPELDLERIARDLARGMKAEKVILFGSRARGGSSRRSDLDLFVVQKTERPPLARIGEGLKLLPPLPCDVDLIVYTPDELSARQETPFMRRLLSEGVILFDTPHG